MSILKNIASQGAAFEAIDTTTTPYSPKTGNASQITGLFSLDGGANASNPFGTTHPTEIGSGLYWQPLAQAETNGNAYSYSWVSATTGIVINPVTGFTSGGNLPTAAPGASGGLVIAGSNAATTFASGSHWIGTVDTITTYTGDTPQTGDSFARIGTTGSGLTSLAPSATALSTATWTSGRATNLDNLDAAVSTRSTYAGGAVAGVTGAVGSVTASVTVGTNTDKTGYSLAPTGLDSVSITAPTGPATNFREMMVQVWRRFFKASAKAVSGLTIKTFADDGTTVVTTQTYTDDGAGNESLGAGS